MIFEKLNKIMKIWKNTKIVKTLSSWKLEKISYNLELEKYTSSVILLKLGATLLGGALCFEAIHEIIDQRRV